MPRPTIAGLGGLAQLEGQPRIRDVDLLLDAQRRGRIDEGLERRDDSGWRSPAFLSSTSRVLGAATGIDSQAIWPGGGVRNVDRLRDRAVGGNVERRAVGHDAGGAAQRELALLGEVAVDLEMRKAPRIGRDLADPAFDQVFEIAVVLLQMMRPEEQALGPDDLAVPGH